jgi:hypothetical protein
LDILVLASSAALTVSICGTPGLGKLAEAVDV